MPPRIMISPCLLARSVCSAGNSASFTLPLRPFSISLPCQVSGSKAKGRFRDPYALAQARARKAANLSRQEELKKQRDQELGSPVRGISTAFVESFDTGHDPQGSTQALFDHFIKPSEIEDQLAKSRSLTTPLPVSARASGMQDKSSEELEKLSAENILRHVKQHENIQEVMKRILNLDNGNAKSRFRANVQRCIKTFGRHQTDRTLPPKAKALPEPSSRGNEIITAEGDRDTEPRKLIERKGPDTGSSEVQIAVLTAKIRSLANFLDTRGRKDKVGKRDLRLLVHRRQKLLKYLKKKERGGPRWQHCIETLGLTEGTWRGEISL